MKASSYSWTPTAAGTGYNWNAGVSNWAGIFPDAAGDIANLNNDIAGAQTVRLRQDITLGVLNLGDASAVGNGYGFTVANSTSPLESFALTFDNGLSAAQIHTIGSGTPTNTISAPVTLNSDLIVAIGGQDFLTLSGLMNMNSHNVSFSGGVSGVNSVTLSGPITGSGVITNNSNMAVSFTGTKTFTGTLVANKGVGGSNSGSFTVINGSLANASAFVINGSLIGNTQSGGSIHAGNGSGQTNNPGQRLTTGTITLNGGTLRDAGQAATVGVANNWQQGLEKVTDHVGVLNFNSGYSHVSLATGTNTAGTTLNVAALQRGAGASGFVSSTALAGTSQLLIANASSFMMGAGGMENTPSVSIIPWLAAANTNGSATSPEGFVTYASNGVRALVAAEYGLSISSGSSNNVSVNALTMAAATTVNSLRFTLSSVSNITDNQTSGTGQILTVTSGGVFFSNNGGAIGGTGSPRSGTLDFGTAEGVVWANGSNVNTIGAVISGSGGLTKAGSGTLIVSGANTYGGTTVAGAGNLQVGLGGVGQTGAGATLLNARGAILSGTGSVRGPATVTFGQICPGDSGGSGIGTLTMGDGLVFAPATSDMTSATFKILDASVADKIVIHGDLAVNGFTRFAVIFDPDYMPGAGDTWSLLDWTGLLTLNGFDVGTNLRDGSGDDETNLDLPGLTGGNRWSISNFADSGALTITIVGVPEPCRSVLLISGLIGLLLRRGRSNTSAMERSVR